MLLLVLILICCSILYWCLIKKCNYWKDRNVPGPKPWPLFGNQIQYTWRKKNLNAIYKDIYQRYPNEKAVGIFRMTNPALLVRDLDIVRDIMIKDFSDFMLRGPVFSTDGLGHSLTWADANAWGALRTRFSPAFSTFKVKAMFPIVLEQCVKAINEIDNICSNKDNIKMDLKNTMLRYTMSNVAACGFGIHVDLSESQTKILHQLDNLIFSASLGIEADMMIPNILQKLNLSLFSKQVTQFFDDLVKNVTRERKGEPSGKNDFMDVMLEMKREKIVDVNKFGNVSKLEITDEVMAAQAFTFFAAGYETSSSTLTFFLYELAMNPEIQEKVIAEIDDVLTKSKGEITYENLNDMDLLKRSLDEALRLHTITDAHFLHRIAMKDYRIAGTDIIVPKGMTVVVSATGIHNDPKYYPNPETFDPDRFLPENCMDRHPCAYMPFGLGPRNCIGYRIARLMILAYMAALLSKYRLEPSTKTPPRGEVKYNPKRLTLSPDGELMINFVRRRS